MDAFNRKYRKLVDKDPYSARCENCDPDAVDHNAWHVTKKKAADRGEGQIVATTYRALFKGPKYPTESEDYECVLTETVERWDDTGDPPWIEPGDPRPGDWRVGRVDNKPHTDVSDAQRKWSEDANTRALNAGVAGRWR